MAEWNCQTGWVRHCAFGLRREWLELYLADREGWRKNCSLGNKQVESLGVWLKTTGIEDSSGRLTPLGKQFLARGTAHRSLWELLWVNVVFNFPTARWYVHLGCGEWTTTELRSLLRETVPHLAERTVSDAILELAGLLERTPVGFELNQGHVTRRRPRRLIRRGVEPCDAAIVHALGQLRLQQGQPRLPWDGDLTWPWAVFGCSRQFVLERLTSIDLNCFDIDEQGVMIHIGDKEWWQCGDIATTLL